MSGWRFIAVQFLDNLYGLERETEREHITQEKSLFFALKHNIPLNSGLDSYPVHSTSPTSQSFSSTGYRRTSKSGEMKNKKQTSTAIMTFGD